ncbi:MAG: FkbM family methyltransferase, partial [Anaerolineales bacterium]|nr:FkbM family methyltransferase [Anaerolineales bacterium]
MPLTKLKTFLMSAWALGPAPADKWALFWRQTKNIRVRLRLGRYHPADEYALQTVYGRLHFRDNFGDITNLANILYDRAYRLTRIAAPGAIVDIGANIGMAAVWFAYHNPGRAVYCFEPLPPNVALIRQNCPRAHVQQVAVGARRGQMTLQVDADSVMASHHVDYSWQTQPV